MAKTHRQIEDASMRLVGDGSNLSKGGEDYDAKYKKLLEQYGLERKETDFEKDMKKYGPSIEEGMKKSRESNATLKTKAAEANTHRAREERSMQPQTEVKASKGGYVEAETREKPKEKVKVKRRVATLAPHGAASTKGTPSTESTITPKPRQSGRTGGANALAPHGAASTKGTPPSAAEREYYKTAGANKEARGHKEGIRLGGPNYGRLKINAIKRGKRFSEAWKAVFKKKKGLISYKNAKY